MLKDEVELVRDELDMLCDKVVLFNEELSMARDDEMKSVKES